MADTPSSMLKPPINSNARRVESTSVVEEIQLNNGDMLSGLLLEDAVLHNAIKKAENPMDKTFFLGMMAGLCASSQALTLTASQTCISDGYLSVVSLGYLWLVVFQRMHGMIGQFYPSSAWRSSSLSLS